MIKYKRVANVRQPLYGKKVYFHLRNNNGRRIGSANRRSLFKAAAVNETNLLSTGNCNENRSESREEQKNMKMLSQKCYRLEDCIGRIF